MFDYGKNQPSSPELIQFVRQLKQRTNNMSPGLQQVEGAPEAFFTKVIWAPGQTNLDYGVRWQRLQPFSYNRYTYFGTLGGTELYLIQLWTDTYTVHRVVNQDYKMIELNTRFDVTKTYNDHTSLASGDKAQLQGADRFADIYNILIKIKNRQGTDLTTIIKNIQPNARNAAYCYFHVVTDNENNEYMIVIDINNAWYYVKKLTE